ncbi:MAG TPA: ZIP family metal transporter [Anaerolineae bacterium]|nr:ZIP family metal transporter [Anaerolineae bacterium]
MTTPILTANGDSQRKASGWKTLTLFLIPVLLLISVIALFWFTSGAGLNVEPAAPIESVAFERTILKPGIIELHLQNTSPQEIQLAQININDAIVPYVVSPDETLPRLARATVRIPYPWVQGNVYNITVFSANSIPFQTTIDVAAETKNANVNTLLSFTLIGLYVGVIPIFLGILWFPALRLMGARTFTFLMAVTVGLLIFLGIDATSEALEQANELGGPFQGVGLVGIGIVGTVVLLDAISRRQVGVKRSDGDQRLTIATMIAIGIGLHNLGEGLAIGAAYSVGAAALGAFLVIGFIIQNITEGLGIIAPIVKDNPSWRKLVQLGVIGGAPAIAGAWAGGLINSQPLAVLFLAVGAGAVFEVVWEIAKLIQKDTAKGPMPLTIFAGIVAGMLMLYATGIFIK